MRLIDRKKLEAQIKEAFRKNPAVMGMLLHWIRRQPPVDAVLVVRCEKCRKMKTYECPIQFCGYDDFCSYGEKEGNQQ